MAKSKSMMGNTGERKLATSHGRGKEKAGGEAQTKNRVDPRESRKRTGSSKQRKG